MTRAQRDGNTIEEHWKIETSHTPCLYNFCMNIQSCRAPQELLLSFLVTFLRFLWALDFRLRATDFSWNATVAKLMRDSSLQHFKTSLTSAQCLSNYTEPRIQVGQLKRKRRLLLNVDLGNWAIPSEVRRDTRGEGRGRRGGGKRRGRRRVMIYGRGRRKMRWERRKRGGCRGRRGRKRRRRGDTNKRGWGGRRGVRRKGSTNRSWQGRRRCKDGRRRTRHVQGGTRSGRRGKRRRQMRRLKNKRRNSGRVRRGGLTEGGVSKVTRNNWRREEWGADKRAPGGVRQGEEVREDRSDRQEVNRRWERGRREEKDRGWRGDSRRGGEREEGIRRGDRGRSSMERCHRLRRSRTQRECRRSKKFWS